MYVMWIQLINVFVFVHKIWEKLFTRFTCLVLSRFSSLFKGNLVKESGLRIAFERYPLWAKAEKLTTLNSASFRKKIFRKLLEYYLKFRHDLILPVSSPTQYSLKFQSLTSSVEITNKMQPCNRIYYSTVHWRLNMFRAAYRSSSGALNCICSLWFTYTCGDRP